MAEKVIIVGGCAGLAVAHDLLKNGYDVTVLEAENRIGGRMNFSKKTAITKGVSRWQNILEN